MIHILRKNETLEDIAQIYKADFDKLSSDNAYALKCENSALWVDCGALVSFNKESGAKSYSPYYSHDELSLCALHNITTTDTAFVPVDNWGRSYSEIFIDAYNINEEKNELELPNDYPAINACQLNEVIPSFFISEPERYIKPEILDMLLNDLSFKQYQNVLLKVGTPSNAKAAENLAKVLKKENLGISLTADIKSLKAIGSKQLFDCFYLKSEKNVFDFSGFEERLIELTEAFPAKKLGVLYAPGCVDINKKTSRLLYLKQEHASQLAEAAKIKRVEFDNASQLCWFKYSEKNGAEHVLLFEDIRTFYAKAGLMLDMGIKKLCFSQCSNSSDVFRRTLGIIK